MKIVAAFSLALALAGCANFQAATDFGHETTAMTATVRAEFRQLAATCVQQAGLVLAINNVTDDSAIDECEKFDRAQGQLARVTVDVLDGYAQALAALADDRAFSVSPGVRAVGAKVAALSDASGQPVVDAQGAQALGRLAGLLVDLAASAKREEAVRRMVEATPALETTGRLLRSFFAVTPGVTPPGARPPYVNMVRLVADATDSAQALLASRPLREAEPIRTAELTRALRPTRQWLAQRDPSKADAVPTRLAAAVDAWLQALAEFQQHALKPDAGQWIARLKALREQVEMARAAVEGL